MRTFFVACIVVLTSFQIYADSVELTTLEPKTPSYFDRLVNKAVGNLFEKPGVSLIQEDGRVYLTGKDIEAKKKLAAQLIYAFGKTVANWSTIDWTKDVDMTASVPTKIRDIGINQRLPTDGINCHSTTLYLSGLTRRLSYVNADEFEYYVDNFCERVNRYEPGAIGISSHKTMFSHSFKIISNNVIFQTKSLSRTEPLRFFLIEDYKTTEFYKCQEIPRQFCVGRYDALQRKVDDLDSVYEQILRLGHDIERRNTAINEIEPLLDQVNQELIRADRDICVQDLVRMKLRLQSLADIAKKIKGNGYYIQDKGLFSREPVY